MNRRRFLGALAGGLVAPTALAPDILGQPVSTAARPLPAAGNRKTVTQGAWVKDGIIDAGGSHEPYDFLVRRGGGSRATRQFCDLQQSVEVIRKLHEQGIEVFHTHFYKGFGIAAEKPFMEETTRAAKIAHGYGMKVDTYIQWNSLMYETFFVEQPRAIHWIQRDADGRPILLDYGYQQSFRYRPCFSNQEYLDYLKEIVRLAIEETKTDFIHFDNFVLNSEPYSCHCPQCVAGFRKRLNAKYTAEERKQRFGFTDVSQINPPLWNEGNPPQKLQVISDPGFQEWIDYRCQMMADALAQLASYVGSLNRDVVVEVNCGGMAGENASWLRGVDYRRILPQTQVFWSEASDQPAYFPDGRLISTIRTFKLARAYHNVVFSYISESEAAMGEGLAFNQTIGYAGQYPLKPKMVQYISFYRRNRKFFVGSNDVANVAIFRSYPSITYDSARAQLSAILAEQTLIQARVPFQLILDEDLRGLDQFKVLLLPDAGCLSDKQIVTIRDFVKAGGGLVAIGETGLYDSWHRLRVEPGLQGLIDHQLPGVDYNYEPTAEPAPPTAGPAIRKQVGEGRVAYLEYLAFDGPLPPMEPYFTIGTRFWKRPKNWKMLVESIQWAAAGEIPLKVSGPEFLIANLVEQPSEQRRMVHLVNYNSQSIPTIRNIDIECAVPRGEKARAVTFYTAGREAPQNVDFQTEGPRATFRVAELDVYGFAAVEW